MQETLSLRGGLVLVVLPLGLLIAGCGETDDGGDAGGTGGTGGVTLPFTKFTLKAFGGFGPAPPAGSTCTAQANPTTLTVIGASRELSFSSCEGPDVGSPWALQVGTRVLTEAELSSVNQALTQVLPSNAMSCGADAGVVTLDVESSGSVQRFADDFYSGCSGELQAGRTFVTGLPELWSVVYALRK